MLAAIAISGSASADPILECGVLAGDDIALTECLRAQLDISSRAMTEAQDLARGAAAQLDERTGTEGAVLGLEAAQLACEIRLTRARTDGILRLGAQGGG